MTAQDHKPARSTTEERLRKREEHEAAAKLVMAEVEAKKAAEQLKTARLRSLRLAKEAADEIQAAAQPKGRKRK